MNTFCTIVNRQYLPFANVLYQSLAKFDPVVKLQVLITDLEKEQSLESGIANLTYHSIAKILNTDTAKGIYNKYAATQQSWFRWAMKPVFLLHLLENGFEKVIFLDADTYFIGQFGFLFDKLDTNSILLVPHWSTVDPLKHEDGLFSVLRNGLFSGCFVGANRQGKKGIQWWAEACHYKMGQVKELGVYDDQKYLDVLPIIDKDTGIVRHQGCNLASISIDTCKREIINGKLMINTIFESVFIHFTNDTIVNIKNGNDILLQPYLKAYTVELNDAGIELGNNSVNMDSSFYAIKRKLLIRTRMKRFFFKLAKKL